jgi:phosphoserine phosphatase
MTTKPTSDPAPARQRRRKDAISLTLSPRTRAVIAAHQADNPDLWSVSAAVDDLIRIAAETLAKPRA